MRIAGTVVGVILILLGGLWILQGANVVTGSVMSGQSSWLFIGIVLAIIGVLMLWLTYRRRS